MSGEYAEVFDNGFGCDLCGQPCVGWTKVSMPDRSRGGVRAVEVFMVCVEHIKLGRPVYPRPRRT